jgi:Flp pilus assembly protein TadD
MQKRNDIYRNDNSILPRRKKDRSPEMPPSGESSPGMFSEREYRASLASDIGMPGSSRPLNQQSNRHRRRRKGRKVGMTLANKLVLGLMLGLLGIYLSILGLSMLKTHRQKMVTSPAPASRPATEALTATISPPPPSSAENMDRAQQDAELTQRSVVAWKKGMTAIEQARMSRDMGDTEAAISRLEGVIEEAPNMVDLKLTLADLYRDAGRHADARDLYLRVLDTDPFREGVRMQLAHVFFALQHFDAALTMTQWSMETDPYVEEANHVAAMCYLNTGRTELAVPHLRRLVAVNRENIVAHNNLAVAYSRLGEFEKAIALFRDVMDADPGNSITYFNMAVCYAQKGEAESAVKTLANAVTRFGMPFVSAWFSSRDFDPIRNTPAFKQLEQAPVRVVRD